MKIVQQTNKIKKFKDWLLYVNDDSDASLLSGLLLRTAALCLVTGMTMKTCDLYSTHVFLPKRCAAYESQKDYTRLQLEDYASREYFGSGFMNRTFASRDENVRRHVDLIEECRAKYWDWLKK